MEPRLFWRELRATLIMALPITTGQVGQILMGLTDTVMLGRIGPVPLAASAFANTVVNVFFLFGIGLLSAIPVLTARGRGAGEVRDASETLRHGFVVMLATSVLMALILNGLVPWLGRFGQPPEVLAVVGPFWRLFSISLIPALGFIVFKSFCEGLGKPWLPMVVLLGGVALNVVLNFIFIYGYLGCPALGLTGSGLATLIARTVTMLILGWCLSTRQEFKEAWPSRWRMPLSRDHFAKIFRLGLPTAGCLLFESGAFAAATVMMGWLGTKALAAHQVALSCAAFTFMFPLSISIAAGIRVGAASGAGERERVRVIGFGTLCGAVGVMICFAAFFFLLGRPIAQFFVQDAEVVALATQLLIVAGVFQLFDGAQVAALGVLRGLTDVEVPTIIAFVAYWVVGLPLGWLTAFHFNAGPKGVWMGLAAGLGTAACLLSLRFHRLTR